jgi:hypothetical protein
MIEPKFKLGDTVYMASYDLAEKTIVCPDCLGSAKVKVTLATGEEIMIECGACDPGGYQGSTGRICQYDYAIKIISLPVTGIALLSDDVEYQLGRNYGGSYRVGTQNGINHRVYATEEEAQIGGEELRKKHEDAENQRFLSKAKDHKTWAWNAAYHRKEIKRIERELQYHNSKIEVCKTHIKDDGIQKKTKAEAA